MLLGFPVLVGCTCCNGNLEMFKVISREKKCIVQYDLYKENLFEVLNENDYFTFVQNLINTVTLKLAASIYGNGEPFIPVVPDRCYTAISIVTSDTFEDILGYELYNANTMSVEFVTKEIFNNTFNRKTYNADYIHLLPKIRMSALKDSDVLHDEFEYEGSDRIYYLNLELEPSKMDVSKSNVLAYWSAHTPERSAGNLGPVESSIYGIEVADLSNAFYSDSPIINIEFTDNKLLSIDVVRFHQNTICIDISNLGKREIIDLLGFGSCIDPWEMPVILMTRDMVNWMDSEIDRMSNCVRQILRRTRVKSSIDSVDRILVKSGIIGSKVLIII